MKEAMLAIVFVTFILLALMAGQVHEQGCMIAWIARNETSLKAQEAAMNRYINAHNCDFTELQGR